MKFIEAEPSLTNKISKTTIKIMCIYVFLIVGNVKIVNS